MRPEGIGVRLPDVDLTGVDAAGLSRELLGRSSPPDRHALVGDVVVRGIQFDRRTGAPKSNAEVNSR